VTACQPAPTRGVAADREQVAAAARRVLDALSRNDAPGLLAEYGDAIIMAPGAPMVQGKQAVTKYVTDLLAAVKFQDVVGNVIDVTASGDLAVETTTFSWTIVRPDGAPPITQKGKYVHVWSRGGDRAWKVIRYLPSTDTPDPPR
jgi:uncharacterized protein (TIGR02246 family)